MTNIQAHAAKGEVLTGLLYVNPDSEDLHAHLNTLPTAFNTLGAKELCPGSGMLEKIKAKAKPGTLNFGSTGAGGLSHLVGELLRSSTGTQMTHVAYKGTGPATSDRSGARSS